MYMLTCKLLLYLFVLYFFLMIRRPPRSTRTDTLFPYTTLFRSYVKKNFKLDFHQYMSKWNLPSDYPTAPAEYVNKKREIAKKTGLGVTTRANRENRAAAAPAATSAKIAKAKPVRNPGQPGT